MPQMSPMNWALLFLYFSLMFWGVYLKIYFNSSIQV